MHTVYIYAGHSVSEIRCVNAITFLLAESWCCLCKAPTFISHNTKETISYLLILCNSIGMKTMEFRHCKISEKGGKFK